MVTSTARASAGSGVRSTYPSSASFPTVLVAACLETPSRRPISDIVAPAGPIACSANP
jgi:hypothetical protein